MDAIAADEPTGGLAAPARRSRKAHICGVTFSALRSAQIRSRWNHEWHRLASRRLQLYWIVNAKLSGATPFYERHRRQSGLDQCSLQRSIRQLIFGVAVLAVVERDRHLLDAEASA